MTALFSAREKVLHYPLAVRWVLHLTAWATLTTTGSCALAALLRLCGNGAALR